MGTFLKKFKSQEEFNDYVQSTQYKTPNISLIKNTQTKLVKYKKMVPSDFYFDFNNDYDIS